MSFVVDLHSGKVEINQNLLGGKGANLIKLANYGFKVPKGFVLHSAAYESFIEKNNLNPKLEEMTRKVNADNLSSDKIRSELRGIREAILKDDLPEAVTQEIVEALQKLQLTMPLVVRSSASLEDSNTASFAGIHDSFLNLLSLRDLLESVKKCYASLWSERAVAYRLTKAAGESVKQAVVIMEMVNAKASGVAFTCHPLSGRPDL